MALNTLPVLSHFLSPTPKWVLDLCPLQKYKARKRSKRASYPCKDPDTDYWKEPYAIDYGTLGSDIQDFLYVNGNEQSPNTTGLHNTSRRDHCSASRIFQKSRHSNVRRVRPRCTEVSMSSLPSTGLRPQDQVRRTTSAGQTKVEDRIAHLNVPSISGFGHSAEQTASFSRSMPALLIPSYSPPIATEVPLVSPLSPASISSDHRSVISIERPATMSANLSCEESKSLWRTQGAAEPLIDLSLMDGSSHYSPVRIRKSLPTRPPTPPPVPKPIFSSRDSMMCKVCLDHLPLSQFPSGRISSRCSHRPRTCRTCLNAWITASVDRSIWDHIVCPDCLHSMNHHDIKKQASEDVFQRYDRYAARSAVNLIPDFHWCMSPSCSSGQIHEQSSGNIMTCSECGFMTCVVHATAWHTGRTCEQYDNYQSAAQTRRKQQNRESMKVILETTKRCPGCRWNIEKADGCDHMVCTNCDHQFCWVCLMPYEPIRQYGNSEHHLSCRYHSNNLSAVAAGLLQS